MHFGADANNYLRRGTSESGRQLIKQSSNATASEHRDRDVLSAQPGGRLAEHEIQVVMSDAMMEPPRPGGT